MTGDPFGDFYLFTAMGAAVVCIVAGIVLAIRNGDDLDDLVMFIFMAVIGGLTAGAAWPLTALVALIAGPTVGLRHLAERRREARQAAEWEQRAAQREALYNPPESDTDKFHRMAKEQWALAVRSAGNGWDDVAEMQRGMAEQYERMSEVYRP